MKRNSVANIVKLIIMIIINDKCKIMMKVLSYS